MSASISVSVRLRPFSARELKNGAPDSIVDMQGKSTFLTHVRRRNGLDTSLDTSVEEGGVPDDVRQFSFDNSFYSTVVDAPNYATQAMVYDNIGRVVLQNTFEGYHSCVFAYGQTGTVRRGT